MPDDSTASPPPTTPIVTQEARDYAADCEIKEWKEIRLANRIRKGGADGYWLVQAFARFQAEHCHPVDHSAGPPTWPEWADELRKILLEYNGTIGDEEGIDLPDELRTWIEGYADEIGYEKPDQSAEIARLLSDDETIRYVQRYGGRCRDCADEDGICPKSGMPCGGSDKAIRFVLGALSYGISNRFLSATPASQESSAAGEIPEGVWFGGAAFHDENGRTFAPWGVFGRKWWSRRKEFPQGRGNIPPRHPDSQGEVERLRAVMKQALSDLNTPGHLGGTASVGGTNGIAARLRRALTESYGYPYSAITEHNRSAQPERSEAEEYMTVTLSREGVVTSHNAFDADFDEMVTATKTIIDTLQQRLDNRLKCPFSAGKALRGRHPIDGATPPAATVDVEERARKFLQEQVPYELDRPSIEQNCSVLAKEAIRAIIAAISASPAQSGVVAEKPCPDCQGRGIIETGDMERGPGGWGFVTIDCATCDANGVASQGAE